MYSFSVDMTNITTEFPNKPKAVIITEMVRLAILKPSLTPSPETTKIKNWNVSDFFKSVMLLLRKHLEVNFELFAIFSSNIL